MGSSPSANSSMADGCAVEVIENDYSDAIPATALIFEDDTIAGDSFEDDEDDCDQSEDDEEPDHECRSHFCGCDGTSVTSEYTYSQEPFETFQLKAKNLALESVWPGADPSEIEIGRMQGDGFNRITGLIHRTPEQPGIEINYILRQPRACDEPDGIEVAKDTAALLFVSRHTSLPTAEVIQMDLTSSNAIESPYMIQTRVAGKDLGKIYSSLSHEQKCLAAKELSDVYRRMLSVRSDTSGHFVLGKDGLAANPEIAPLQTKQTFDPELDEGFESYRPTGQVTETVFDLLTKLFNRTEAIYSKHFPDQPWMTSSWTAYAEMARELETLGWFRDVDYCLAHLDLDPRNILADPSNKHAPLLTAILDWDIAYLAPSFAACKPPQWLWSPNMPEGDIDEDEKTANDDPATPELRQIKQLSEDGAGEEYRRFAYEPAYRLARRLFQFAVEGDQTATAGEEGEEMLGEWEAIKGTQPADRSEAQDGQAEGDAAEATESGWLVLNVAVSNVQTAPVQPASSRWLVLN